MDYFISVHPRSNVRFSALFLDLEEKSSFHLNDFPSLILSSRNYTMTDVDVNAPAELAPTMALPTRTDDQILPHIRWVSIGKSNCYLDVDRLQSNPIFKIAHKFHTRPGSPLHLPNKEPVLGYLKFSSKGTKREVFGMPIRNDLVMDDIRGKQYYNAYLEKIAKHQRYLAGEDVSDPDSLAPKPTKGAKQKTSKKPTSSQQTKPKTKSSTPSQPPKPKPAPAKPQEKKRKRALDAAEAPSQAKRSKVGRVSKKRTLQLRDEFIDEGVPATEPRIDDEEAIVQKVLEESMKGCFFNPAHRGPQPPLVFRNLTLESFITAFKGQGWAKRKGRRFKAHSSTEYQSPTPATAENPLVIGESSSLYAELVKTEVGTESDGGSVLPEMNAQGQKEAIGGTNPLEIGWRVSDTIKSCGSRWTKPGLHGLRNAMNVLIHNRPNIVANG
ncbi:hypothetical protein Tco_1044099 [Tanacetum coccineum]|uniref:Histone deacetylase 14 n=1 Tax=Tanacetum coccineum TaxID=301880 RepID=A0ABQ5GQ71_9ASTR